MPDHTIRRGSEIWRTGRSVGRTVYVQATEEPAKGDRLIGVMDTPELAERVVAAVNAVERLEALCERALADDGTVFEDPMPLPGWVTLIRNALRGPDGH
jgi:hypothetical protein